MLLPKPDEYGNYWFDPSKKDGPAIFPSKFIYFRNSKDQEGVVTARGSYYIMFADGSFLFDGPHLARFKNLQLALDSLS